MTKKKILAKIGGTENPELKEIEIKKGTETADILRALGLPQTYQIFRRSANAFLQPGQDLFSILEDGEKVEVSPPSEIAGEMWDAMSHPLSFFIEKLQEEKAQVIGTIPIERVLTTTPQPTLSTRPVIHQRDVIQAEPAENLGLEAELANRGWARDGRSYYGKFSGNNGDSCQAMLICRWGTKYELYLRNPPACVFTGQHRFCFIPRGEGWYFVHFKQPTAPIDQINRVQAHIKERGRSYV
jgi:hypothetical protein